MWNFGISQIFSNLEQDNKRWYEDFRNGLTSFCTSVTWMACDHKLPTNEIYQNIFYQVVYNQDGFGIFWKLEYPSFKFH